jgi:3-dehydroquinate synthase
MAETADRGQQEVAASAGQAVHVQRFAVTYEYPVHFTRDLFDPPNPVLVDTLARLERDRRHRCMVFLDDGLAAALPGLAAAIEGYAAAHADRMALVAAPVQVPGGERIKMDLHFVEDMQRRVVEQRLDRHSYIIGIGGGALLDAVGLVAAVTHRGIRHIRVPTTVLSQNDSGVGVKNGVNFMGQKNLVGTFAPPFAVLNDLDLIDSLPPREKIAGMAEAVKVALIRDAAFFHWLERHADHLATFRPESMAWMIRRCAELHMHQIAHGGDPFETGSARPLDFGHWSAHKLEGMTRHHLRHGEAVAIGIALDARYSVLAGLLPEGADERIAVLLEHLGFRLWHAAVRMTSDAGDLVLLEGLREFQEHLGGELTVTLLEGIGQGVEVHEMDVGRVAAALDWLEARQAA